MVKVTGENGGTNIKRKIYFKRDEHEFQSIEVEVYCEGEPSPEEIKRIAEIVETARDEIRKIVEQW